MTHRFSNREDRNMSFQLSYSRQWSQKKVGQRDLGEEEMRTRPILGARDTKVARGNDGPQAVRGSAKIQ